MFFVCFPYLCIRRTFNAQNYIFFMKLSCICKQKSHPPIISSGLARWKTHHRPLHLIFQEQTKKMSTKKNTHRHTYECFDGVKTGRSGKPLSACIHAFVVLLVLAGGDVVHPFLVVEIPSYRLFYALLELKAGFPTEFLLEFR